MGILSVVFWAPSISAQTPDEWEWSRKLATSQNEFASSIAVDRLNNAVYTAGQADKAFSGVLGGPWAVMYGSNTGSDGYLVKHSLDGTLQWQIVVGAGGNDGITGVCTDMLGRVYVTGYFSATNASFTGAAGSSQTMSSTGGEDIFVACYNANGALQWNIRAGGAGNDRGNGICYANGKIFVGGSYSGSAVIAGMATTSTSAGNANTSHAFLTALQASDGSGEWLAAGFNGENSTFNAVATDGTQVYALGVHTGTSYTFGSSTGPATLPLSTTWNNLSADVLAVSATGQLNWAQAVANSASDAITALGLAASTTAVYISGSSHNNSVFPGGVVVAGTGSPHDYGYLARLNKNSGQTAWVRTFSGSSNHDQVGRALATDSHGDVLLAGTYKQSLTLPNGTPLSGANDVQVFVSKFNGSGGLKWAITPMGDKDDRPNGVALDGNGGVYAAGSYQKEITFNTFFSDDNSENLFVAKLHDMDFDVAEFRDPSRFIAPGPFCMTDGPLNLASLLIPERSGTGIAVFSSSGIGSSGSNGPGGALGMSPGGVAVFDNSGDQIVIDLGNTIPVGEKLIIRWRSTGGAAMMNVQGSFAGAGGFTDHGMITTSSTVMVLTAVVATAPMRFIKLTRAGSTTCEVDGVFYNFGSATDGTWSGDGVTGTTFDPSGISGNANITYTANGHSTTITVTVSPVSVVGILTGGGTFCPGSDVPFSLAGPISGSIVWQTSTNGGTTWTNNFSNLTVDTLIGVTQATSVKVKVTSGACPAATSNTVNVIPLDTDAPVISGCPGNINVNGFTNNSVVNWTVPTALDNCTGVSIVRTSGPAPGSTFTMGTTPITYVASDGSGNTASCNFTVTVSFKDPSAFTAPGPFCAADAPVDLTSFLLPIVQGHGASVFSSSGVATPGSALGSGAYGTGALFDDPGDEIIIDLGVTIPSGGSVVIRWRAVSGTAVLNVGGASAGSGPFTDLGDITTVSSSMIFTAVTTTVPMRYLRMRMTGSGNLRVDAVLYDFGSLPGGTWGGPGVSGNVFDPAGMSGNLNVTYSVDGHTTTHTVSVSPVSVAGVLSGGGMICPGSDAPLSLSSPISGSIVWQTSTDGGTSWTSDPSGLTVDTLHGVIQATAVRVRVTSGICPADTSNTVHVIPMDTNSPVLSGCPGNITVGTDASECGAIVAYTAPTATDNCTALVTVENSDVAQVSGSFFPVGTSSVEFRSTDASGNTGTCSFTITVTDDEAPAFICPSDTVIATEPGLCGAHVSYALPTATDQCDGTVTVTATQSANAPESLFPVGTTTVVLTATDAAGNSSTCSFSVTVNDVQAPDFTAPADTVLATAPGLCGAILDYTIPSANDACDGMLAVMVVNSAQTPGSTFPIGSTSVLLRATDIAGNNTEHSFTVTVLDDEAPLIACPTDISVLSGSPDCGAHVHYSIPTAMDNCATLVPVVNSDATQAPDSLFPVGVTIVQLVASDNSGNTGTCSFSITVIDVSPPTFTAPTADTLYMDANGQAAMPDLHGQLVGLSDCSGMGPHDQTPDAGSVVTGDTTATLHLSDGVGNDTTISVQIVLLDTISPTISCPDTIHGAVTPGQCGVVLNIPPPQYGDNSGIAILDSTGTIFSGDLFPAGTYTVNYTVTDPSGLTASCPTTVIVLSPVLELTYPVDTICSSAGPISPLGMITGGTFSASPAGLNVDASMGVIAPLTSTAGSYTIYMVFAGPCPDTASTTITIEAQPNAGTDATTTICSIGDPVDLFALLGNGADAGGTWSVGNGTYDPAMDSPGTFTYTVSGGLTCADAQASITVTETLTMNAGADSTITLCGNGTLVDLSTLLNGADAGGDWSNGSGQYDPVNDDPGTVMYIVVGSGQCPSDTAFITVLEQTPPNAGISADLALCSNGIAVNLFTALGGAPDNGGQWSQSDGTLIDGIFDPASDLADSFTYTVDAMAPCSAASSVVTVTVANAPSAAWASPAALCNAAQPIDLSNTLTGESGGTWSGPGIAPDGQHFDPSSLTPQGSSEDFTVTYSVTMGGCTSAQSGPITVLASPVANAGTDGVVCGLEHTLAASLTIGSGTWSATSGITFNDPEAPTTAVHVPGPGNYALVWTVTNGPCSAFDTVMITFHLPEELTAMDAGPDQEQNISRSAMLNGVAEGATEVHWSVISGSGSIVAPDQTSTGIDGLSIGTNLIMLSARVGVCPFASDTTAITVRDLFIPSGFSPNGDGVNDSFEVTGIDAYPGNELTVFNRYGQQVFHVTGYANGWDGKDENGKELADGTYFYVLGLTAEETYHGQVIIKR